MFTESCIPLNMTKPPPPKKVPILQKLTQSYPSLARYLKNTLWMLVERVLRMAMALLVGVYVARYLGPIHFGALSYAIAFVSLFSVIATVGLDSIVVRDLVKNPERQNELLGTAFFLKIIGTICMWGILFVGVQFTNNSNYSNTLIAVIAFGALFQAFSVIECKFQANVQSRYVVKAQIIQLIISSITKLLLIGIKAPLLWFAVVITCDSIMLMVLLIWQYIGIYGNLCKWRIDAKIAAKLFKDAWPLIPAGMAVMAYMRIDQLMIKEMINAHALGEYAVAVRLAEVWYFIPMVVCTSLFPAIIHIKNSNEILYRERLQQLYDLMVCIALPIVISITAFADKLVIFLFGDPFSGAGPVLSIYIWSIFVSFLGVASSQYLTADNLIFFSFIRTFLGLVFNIVLNIVLIPKYGITGAAIATLVSYSISTFSLVAFKRTRLQAVLMFRALFLVNLITKIRRLHVT